MTLREARFRKGLRQMDLAIRCQINATKISHFETGLMLPNFNEKMALAAILGLEVGDLEFPLVAQVRGS